MTTMIVRVPEGAAMRADRLLARHLSGFSRRRIQSLLRQGLIRIDGKKLRKGETFAAGSELEIEVRASATAQLAPEAEPAPALLYEDRWLVAVDKPAGRPGHALGPEDRGTIANFLAARYPEMREAGSTPLEHGLVHRLDTDTSGVLLAARTREAWLELRRQFREREVEKRYLALVAGSIANADEIARPIEPDPRNRRKVRVSDETGPHTRSAITHYRPIARYEGYTLLEVEITTGMMHQIRAHLAAIGHPVAGDSLYGRASPSSLAAPRHLLHAAILVVTHPDRGDRLRIESPLPQDFADALTRLAKREEGPISPRGYC